MDFFYWEKEKKLLEKILLNLSDYNQFLFLQKFEVDKNRYFPVKNWEIQVIVSIIMLTLSSERIFLHGMRYTGIFIGGHMMFTIHHIPV